MCLAFIYLLKKLLHQHMINWTLTIYHYILCPLNKPYHKNKIVVTCLLQHGERDGRHEGVPAGGGRARVAGRRRGGAPARLAAAHRGRRRAVARRHAGAAGLPAARRARARARRSLTFYSSPLSVWFFEDLSADWQNSMLRFKRIIYI